MKVLFVGTPEVAVPALAALLDSSHEVIGVLSRPDAPVGRKKIITASPVAAFAEEHNIPVIRSSVIDEHTHHKLLETGADIALVVAYGTLIPQESLDIFPHGWLNLHFSSLPAYRGAAPVQWAIRDGADHTATSVFQLVGQLDAGELVDTSLVPIGPDETATELLQRLSLLGAHQLVRVLDSLESGKLTSQPQIGTVTYAPKLSLADAHLDVSGHVDTVYNQYRSVTTEPGAFVLIAGDRFKILEAHKVTTQRGKPATLTLEGASVYLNVSDGSLQLTRVQPSGKNAMMAADWARGQRQSELPVT